MSNKPPLNWSAVLRDLKSDRAARSDVREERLRVAQGLRGAPALALSAWRGRSGKRYVVGVHPIAGFHTDDADQAVVLFVARDAHGVSALIFGARDLEAIDIAHMIERAAALGCTEVHVHRLAEMVGERAAILADLAAPAMEIA